MYINIAYTCPNDIKINLRLNIATKTNLRTTRDTHTTKIAYNLALPPPKAADNGSLPATIPLRPYLRSPRKPSTVLSLP
jgi:hypothetical protein